MLDPSQRYNHGFIHAHTRILKNIMKLGLRCPLQDFEFYVFLLFSHLNSSIPARFPIFLFLFYYFLSDQTEHCSGLNSPSPFQIDTFNIFFFFFCCKIPLFFFCHKPTFYHHHQELYGLNFGSFRCGKVGSPARFKFSFIFQGFNFSFIFLYLLRFPRM